jgi:dynein heavy chain 2
VTRNPRPAIPPAAASVICEVNFTVTRSGLEGQLLGLVIQHEQPEIERQKSQLLQTEAGRSSRTSTRLTLNLLLLLCASV